MTHQIWSALAVALAASPFTIPFACAEWDDASPQGTVAITSILSILTAQRKAIPVLLARWPHFLNDIFAAARRRLGVAVETTDAIDVPVAVLAFEPACTHAFDAFLRVAVHVDEALPSWVQLSSTIVGASIDALGFVAGVRLEQFRRSFVSQSSLAVRPNELVVHLRHAPLAEALLGAGAPADLHRGFPGCVVEVVDAQAPIIVVCGDLFVATFYFRTTQDLGPVHQSKRSEQ